MTNRIEMMALAKQLHHFHRQATALEDEYTAEMYDFLVSESIISLTTTDKLAIFAKAKMLYKRELDAVLTAKDLHKEKAVFSALRSLKTNKLTDAQREYLGFLCKKISIKDCFDSLDRLEFK